jgi:hypothetical protein
MNITLVSIPAVVIQSSPEILSRLLATESPNNFRLQRKDFSILSSAEGSGSPSGCMEFTLGEAFAGSEGDIINVYNAYNQAVYTGTVTDVANSSPDFIIQTDIPYDSDFDGSYLNDITLFAGFYFEGRLTVNDVVQPLTVQASPDTSGVADLDVSGILRIVTSLEKVGDYSFDLMSETNKSGKFTLAYRAMWYGASNSWTEEGGTWYYVEAVRSVEQGSNLSEYLFTEAAFGEFLNSFTQPVYFTGLPWDISFFVPGDLQGDIVITVTHYNSLNEVLSTDEQTWASGPFLGRIASFSLNPVTLEEYADHFILAITNEVPS